MIICKRINLSWEVLTMEEIKEMNDNDLGDVAGGVVLHRGTCFRCGDSDSNFGEYCNHTWYGKLCCNRCFDILSKREEEDYKNGNREIIKQNDELTKQLKLLVEKLNNKYNNNMNNNNR